MPKFKIVYVAVFIFFMHTHFILSQNVFHRTLAFLSAKGERFSQKAVQHLLILFMPCVAPVLFVSHCSNRLRREIVPA